MKARTVYQALQAGHPVEVWIETNWSRPGVSTWTAWDGRTIRYSYAEHAVTLSVRDSAALLDATAEPQQQCEQRATEAEADEDRRRADGAAQQLLALAAAEWDAVEEAFAGTIRLHPHAINDELRDAAFARCGEPVGPGVLADLAFAWKACRSVKSNAILLAVGGASVGVGMGQVNRVDSARLAVQRAGDRAAGSVAASDAYFPFPDGFEILAQAGVRAVAEPGGSIRDHLVIAAAEAAGIPLYFTGVRHFYH